MPRTRRPVLTADAAQADMQQACIAYGLDADHLERLLADGGTDAAISWAEDRNAPSLVQLLKMAGPAVAPARRSR